MVINTKVFVNGTEYPNHKRCVIERSNNEYDSSSFAEIELPNPYGRYSSDRDPYYLNTDKLAAYFPMENSADDVHGGYNGTVSSATFTTSEKVLGSYSAAFGGAGANIQVPAAATNSLASGAIALWVKLTNESASYNIFAKNSAAFRCQYSSVEDDIYFQVDNESVDYTGVNLDWTTWHHVICAWDGTYKYIVVDGVLRMKVATANDTPSSGVLYLGHNSVNSTESLVGYLDEVAIFNEIITGISGKSVGDSVTAEAARLYNNGVGKGYPFDTAHSLSVGQDVIVYAAKDIRGYYKLDGDSTDFYGGNDGTDTSITYVAGKLGSAADFNGTTSNIALPTSNTLFSRSDAWSFMCWFNADTFSGTDVIAETSGLGASDIGFSIRTSTAGVLTAVIYDNTDTVRQFVVSSSLSTGTWYHVALTYDGTTYNTYLNGVLVNSNAYGFIGFGSSTTRLGRIVSAASGFYDGKLDEAVFFGYALSPQEVSHAYNYVGFPGTPFFGGYLEDKDFSGPGSAPGEVLRISGRGYVSILHDASVQPVVYTSDLVEDIVADLVGREAPSLDITDVDATGVTLDRISFSHISLYDALKQLAELADCYFYVDGLLALHFKKLQTVSSGYEFIAGSNITDSYVNESRKPMYNKVWVYGDKIQVEAPTKNLAQSGTGSVFSLDYKPHNVTITLTGTNIPLQGGILNFVGQTDPGSGVQYLVNYNDKQIVFVSGTNAGNNIPSSGTDSKFTIEYYRERQIIRYMQDQASIDAYKAKTNTIIDRNIKDPAQAALLALNGLDKNAHPFKEINTSYKGWADLIPGATAGVYEPYQDVSGNNFNIIRTKYEFTPETLQTEKVLQVTLNKKLVDGADVVKQALLDIKRLRAQDVLTDETYTRLQAHTPRMGVRVSSWSVSTGGLGSSFVLGHPTLGVLGTTSPQPYLGDSRPAKTVQYSGGEV